MHQQLAMLQLEALCTLAPLSARYRLRQSKRFAEQARSGSWVQGNRLQAAGGLQPSALAQKVLAASTQSVSPVAPEQSRAHDSAGRLMLKNLTLPQLQAWCTAEGDRPQRAQQLWRWMYFDGFWLPELDAATEAVRNGFSRAFREKYRDKVTLDGGLRLEAVHTAADGTRKLVFRLTCGEGAGGSVEAVLIPVHRAGGRPRLTLCVSSQVGCAMNCQFCYTGRMGLRANLSTAQIVEQVVAAQRLLALDAHSSRAGAQRSWYVEQYGPTGSSGDQVEHSNGDSASQPVHVLRLGDECADHVPPFVSAATGSGSLPAAASITNLVFMGMGEPLHNMEAVLAAVSIMTDERGLQLSHNRVTVSTVGLVPEIREFCRRSPAQLAVSLHATTDEVRDWIVPVANRRHPLGQLMGCLAELYPRGRCQGGRHVLFEYVMLRGVNDSLADAARLLELAEDIECKVNLIQFNPHEGTSFAASSTEQIEAFRTVLVQGGRVCTIRASRGDDEMAACGQLGEPGRAPAGSAWRPPPRLSAPSGLLAAHQ